MQYDSEDGPNEFWEMTVNNLTVADETINGVTVTLTVSEGVETVNITDFTLKVCFGIPLTTGPMTSTISGRHSISVSISDSISISMNVSVSTIIIVS